MSPLPAADRPECGELSAPYGQRLSSPDCSVILVPAASRSADRIAGARIPAAQQQRWRRGQIEPAQAWEQDRTIIRFPDPAVETVDPRFAAHRIMRA